ncbi:MAG: PQQ-binding-like beta-propeller repeat protein [Acidobacteriota bacterium]|nr:PQQ-binding-like beta-propeller repeat protein [Acidobacteriota bacterium]
MLRPRSSLTGLVGLAALLLLTAAPALDAAAQWPQWRGPDRDGKAPDQGLLTSWPEGGPPLLLTATGLGAGYSSVSVSDGKIFTLGDLENGQHVFAIDAASGEILWKTHLGAAWDDRFPGPRSTPTIDGDTLYALGTEGDLVSLSVADGKVLWKKNLVKDFGGQLMKAQGTYDWKWVESPLVDGDRLIVTPGAADAVMVALNKKTGEEIWRAQLPELEGPGVPGAAYSSVVISEGAGVRQYVQLVGQGVIGVATDTGRFLWAYTPVANEIANIATPLIDGDTVFASTGYGTGAALLKLVKTETGVDAEEVYFLPAEMFQNHHGGMILDDGTIYTGTGHNKGLPIALDKDKGQLVWGPLRNDGRSSAAIAYADGHLYLRYQNGLMLLVEATPEAYREKGSFEIPNVQRESWSHPVIADGRLYLREQENLYVYDLKPRMEKKASGEGAGGEEAGR